jgi:hypothetical protein
LEPSGDNEAAMHRIALDLAREACVEQFAHEAKPRFHSYA